jgi:hypothetical protein
MPANSDALRSWELEPLWLPVNSLRCSKREGHDRIRRRQELGDERGRVKAALVGGPQDGREDLLPVRYASGAIAAAAHLARDDRRAQRLFGAPVGRVELGSKRKLNTGSHSGRDRLNRRTASRRLGVRVLPGSRSPGPVRPVHLAPSTARFVWACLPTTIAFIGLVTAVSAERVSVRRLNGVTGLVNI